MPFKLGMLGMWHTHADGIVRRVAENPREFELVGFHDTDPQTAVASQRKWEKLLPSVRIFDSAEKLLAEKLDGIVIEGRVFENLKLARLALESGRPVLLEKPAGDNFDDFRRLVDLAQRKHLHLQMTYLFRYMSAMREILSRAKKGEFGQIYAFRARLPKDLPSYQRYVDELIRYPGGIFFEMAGHVIDAAVALLGKPSKVTPFLAHHHATKGTFIDNGIAILGWEHAWGIIDMTALEVAPHARRIEVFGTEGAAVIPHLGSGHLANKNIQPIEVFRVGQPDWQAIELPAATLQIGDLREFVACATGKKAPDYTLDHDLATQETLLKASGMMG